MDVVANRTRSSDGPLDTVFEVFMCEVAVCGCTSEEYTSLLSVLKINTHVLTMVTGAACEQHVVMNIRFLASYFISFVEHLEGRAHVRLHDL